MLLRSPPTLLGQLHQHPEAVSVALHELQRDRKHLRSSGKTFDANCKLSQLNANRLGSCVSSGFEVLLESSFVGCNGRRNLTSLLPMVSLLL